MKINEIESMNVLNLASIFSWYKYTLYIQRDWYSKEDNNCK